MHLLTEAGFVIGVQEPTHSETTSKSKVTLPWGTGAASFVECGIVNTVDRSHHVSPSPIPYPSGTRVKAKEFMLWVESRVFGVSLNSGR
jgi:hypothetical protein